MRLFVGLLLVIASALKGIDLYQHPTSVLGGPFSWFLSPLLIGGELGFGLLILSGLYWKQIRKFAIVSFLGFSGYSLTMALQGAASCGCFGQIEVNPWWTFLLDLVVVASLVMESISEGRNVTGKSASHSKSRVVLVGSSLLALTVAAGLSWHVAPRQAVAGNEFQTAGGLIILEPETWEGKTFPLTDYIDLDFSAGKWVLLLHRHDCPECQEAVPQYEQLAAASSLDRQVAIIEVPPYGSHSELHSDNCQTGRLSDRKEWFVQTPMEILLENGKVTSVSSELAFLHGFSEGRNEPSKTVDHLSLVALEATFSEEGKKNP